MVRLKCRACCDATGGRNGRECHPWSCCDAGHQCRCDTVASAVTLIIVLASGLAGMLNVMGCQVNQPPTVKLVIQASPVRVYSDYSRAAIAGLADRVIGNDVKDPAGFFVASLSYKIKVLELSQSGARCDPSYQVELTALLDHRTIEVANDLPNARCSYGAAVTHYGRILAADEQAVVTASSDLGSALSVRLAGKFLDTNDHLSPEEYRRTIVDLAKTVVDEHTPETLERRVRARAAVRDSDDVEAAIRSCGKGI